MIREQAYRIWEREGHPHGRDMDHWFEAEASLGTKTTAKKTTAKRTTAKKATAAKPETKSKTKTAKKTVKPVRKKK
jgi:topoisomerase IA-like protein